MRRIAIFKTGTHTDTRGDTLTFTADYLKEVVAGYDPATHESPAVIGHPKDNHPAYGWVKSLSFDDGTGMLYANFEQVDPAFEAMLKAGRFKKRSASFYPPTHPSNPTKGKPYLRHVGFLGAQPPAVKGLPDMAFSELSGEQDCPIVEFAELPFVTDPNIRADTGTDTLPAITKDTFMNTKTTPTPEQPADASDTDTITNSADDKTTDNKVADNKAADQNGKLNTASHSELVAKEQALAEREKALAKREAAFAQAQQDIKQQDFSEFAEGLIGKGQLVPSEKSAIVDVMMDLDAVGKTFDFSENGKVAQKSSVDVLKGILSRLETTVDFGEHTADDPNERVIPSHIAHDSDDELDKQIHDYAQKHGLSYPEAAISFAR